MIPLCLVTGFLGCGKTTFLRKTIRENQHRRIVYLVNEFSSHDVDGPLISEAGGMAVSVPGGSIFCTCLITEFINNMTLIAKEIHTDENPVEGVVIEASGMANPKVIEKMLEETRLNKLFQLDQIITVLEPRSLLRLIHTLPNIVSQVEAADVVLLNKCDLFEESQIKETEEKVMEIQPSVRCVRTENAVVDLELFPSNRPLRGLKGEYAKCRDPNYLSMEIHPSEPLCLDSFTVDLNRVGKNIYRLKGIADTDQGRKQIDYSLAELKVVPAPDGRVLGLACILPGDAEDEAREWLQAL